MSTANFLNNVISKAKSASSAAFEFLGEEIFLPAVYPKKDVAKVKLKSLQIETSDGIGIGEQLIIKIEGLQEIMYDPELDITGLGFLAYPDTPILASEEVKIINANTVDEDLFFLETRSIPDWGYPRTSDPTDFKIVIQVTIDEDDPTYDDHSSFIYTHYIPYQNKYSYLESFSITHFTSFYEGPIRKSVNVKFAFDFEFNMIQAMDEIEIIIYYLRRYIKGAASKFSDVSAGFVAAIIYDELYHRDIFDDWQDSSNPFTLVEQVFINRSGEANAFIGRKELPDLDVTIGFGQISINGLKARVAQGHLNASDIPGYNDNPDEAAINFLLDPRTAPVAVAATLHHLIAFINNENEGAWSANNYPQAVAYFYSSGYGSNGEIIQNPGNGNEKIARIDRLEKVMNLQ